MLVDYVWVYQRKGQTNIGCEPPGYPTVDYTSRHLDTYSSEHDFYFICCCEFGLIVMMRYVDPNFTAFNYAVPKNGLVRSISRCCRLPG
jgi:beta-glucan synthesis-associated protein KRE6